MSENAENRLSSSFYLPKKLYDFPLRLLKLRIMTNVRLDHGRNVRFVTVHVLFMATSNNKSRHATSKLTKCNALDYTVTPVLTIKEIYKIH